MDNLSTRQKLIKSFDYFISKIYNLKKFTSTKIPYEKSKPINDLSKNLDLKYNKSLGSDWYFKYFCFQFEYWRTKVLTSSENNIVEIHWVLGPKAYKRWEDKKDNYWYFCQIGLLKQIPEIDKISFKELIFNEKDIKISSELKSKLEEIEKERYYNQEKGLIHCMLTTTLFNPYSDLCKKCTNRVECKKILKKNFSDTYNKRNEFQNFQI